MGLSPPLLVDHPQESAPRLPLKTWVCPSEDRDGGAVAAWIMRTPNVTGAQGS